MLPETTTPTIPELLDKLEALGDPGQIAIFFEDQKIVALPCRASGCAVAIYLQRETGLDIAVGDRQCSVWRGCQPDQIHELPGAVRDFIDYFDDLDYPGLIDWPRMAV